MLEWHLDRVLGEDAECGVNVLFQIRDLVAFLEIHRYFNEECLIEPRRYLD